MRCGGGRIDPRKAKIRVVDDEQLRELRRWADGLAAVESPELRAAGRAIVMLSDEVEALRAQLALEHDTAERLEEAAPAPIVSDAGRDAELGGALRTRLRSFTRRRAVRGANDSEPEQDRSA
jgi:hypothetical protein